MNKARTPESESKEETRPSSETKWPQMSRAEVALCWSGINGGADLIIIDNEVYDISEFSMKHPGGSDVLHEFVGADATIAFEAVGHSIQARKMMKKYHVASITSCDRVIT